jgi:hypothetical protein
MRSSTWLVRSLVFVGLVGSAMLVACSSSKDSGFGENGASSGNNASGGNGPSTSGGMLGSSGGASSGANPTGACVPDPKNYDIPGNNCDDDGDGTVDNPPTCDTMITASDATSIARTLGVCDDAPKRGFGLVSATLKQGNAAQAGTLGKFGDVIKPREGVMLTTLSTGYGQEYDGSSGVSFGLDNTGGGGGGKGGGGGGLGSCPGGHSWGPTGAGLPGTVPSGFPKPAAGCPIDSHTNDVVQLTLTLQAPPNANGVQFDFNFYSGEWPAWVCTNYNDGFIAYLSAKGFNGGTPDNMSFDSKNNPVSVNNGFFDRCTPGVEIGCANGGLGGLLGGGSTSTSVCPSGPGELSGTGFGKSGQWCNQYDMTNGTSTNGGATGWLTSKAPVQAGETFTLDFYIWDTGDGCLDSSVLLDHLTWLGGEVSPGTARPN